VKSGEEHSTADRALCDACLTSVRTHHAQLPYSILTVHWRVRIRSSGAERCGGNAQLRLHKINLCNESERVSERAELQYRNVADHLKSYVTARPSLILISAQTLCRLNLCTALLGTSVISSATIRRSHKCRMKNVQGGPKTGYPVLFLG